jgi:adducin
MKRTLKCLNSFYYPIKELSKQNMDKKLNTSILHEFSKEEKIVRIQLAACYRLFHKFKWDDTIYGHLTAKIPNTNHFLINPFGLLYKEITASSLVKVDLEGKIVHPGTSGLSINGAGYVIHSAIHKNRNDIHAVFHSHQFQASAVSCSKFIPISQTSHTIGPFSHHDYDGIFIDENLQKRLVNDLGKNRVLILRNHGVVTCGSDCSEAFLLMNNLIEACKIQSSASSMGKFL